MLVELLKVKKEATSRVHVGLEHKLQLLEMSPPGTHSNPIL